MSEVFLKIINMSIAAGWLILAVVILRLVLKKAPKWVNVLLWGIVAVRLICPFSIESAWSLIPSAETVPLGIEMDAIPAIDSGIQAIDRVVDPVIASSFTPAPLCSANPLQIWIPILGVLWAVGVAAFVLYAAVSYWHLRRKVIEAVILRDNIFQSENVGSPFVLGIIKPKIYLSYHMDAQNLDHVVAHEQAHIRRKDHWWKPLGFLLLTIHWFNPLMWLAYLLLCRDIELACDEKVIKGLECEQRADYTQALVACSVGRRMITACPLAFGEVGVKARVKSVMNYKKPAFWIIVLAILICAAVAVCFLTNPVGEADTLLVFGAGENSKTYIYENEGIMGSFTITLYDDGTFTYYEGMASSYIGVGSWEQDGDTITLTDDGHGGYGLVNHFKLDGDDLVFVEQDSANFVYVKVSNGEKFHCTGEAFKQNDGADDSVQIMPGRKLSLDDVIRLSQKGNDLTWSDFEQYQYIETGSGLYIRIYEINEMYELRIGGAGPDSDPMYIYLALADDLDTRIDIRDGGVEEFIAADHSEVLLTNAIYDAILEHNKPSKPDGLYHCASFVLLDRQELCICSDPPTPMHIIVYGMALHQAFGFTDTGLDDVQGSHIPVVLTFEEEDGGYTLLEYWQPRDGSYYVQDIRDKFPDEVEDDALDTQKYIVSQVQNCYDQAIRYGGVDTDTVIGHLLEVIASSPAQSSNPGDYIEERAIEYRELTYYGQYTLRYCFEQFLKGGQNDLIGHIMALACQDIADTLGEKDEPLENVVMTGQDWFDGFYDYAQVLARNHSAEELEKYYPVTYLLLQMTDFVCGYPLAPEQEVLTEIIKIDPSKIMTEPTDGFGANVPSEWLERDPEMMLPMPEEDTDPNFSMPADGSTKNDTRIQIVPAP